MGYSPGIDFEHELASMFKNGRVTRRSGAGKFESEDVITKVLLLQAKKLTKRNRISISEAEWEKTCQAAAMEGLVPGWGIKLPSGKVLLLVPADLVVQELELDDA